MSTGNDIVALNAINITRTNQPKFYSRILSPSEREFYKNPEFSSIPFENLVWLLWSIKEAAFKFLKRNNPDLVFSPTKFIISELIIPFGFETKCIGTTEITNTGFDQSAFNGVLIYQSSTIFFRSLLFNELTMSVVNDVDNFDQIHWGIKKIDNSDTENQSKSVREFLIANVKKQAGFENIAVSKNDFGIPTILKGGKELPIPVSLSHHDDWVGYSFQLSL